MVRALRSKSWIERIDAIEDRRGKSAKEFVTLDNCSLGLGVGLRTGENQKRR